MAELVELHITSGLIAEVEVRFTGRMADPERIQAFEEYVLGEVEKASERFLGPEATPELFDSGLHTRHESVWTDDGMLRTTMYDLRTGESELISEYPDKP